MFAEEFINGSGSNPFFAIISKRIQIKPNYNLFDANNYSNSVIKDFIYVIPSIFVLGLFVFVFCCRKKQKVD